ncbi:unnamed protein product [Citrullus colocynthis]|uniref:Uncharacterized protein n=1 Tax=Citrullus colocynthis TaxID=252529 RepID=A0ABP0Y2G9_9ROSI
MLKNFEGIIIVRHDQKKEADTSFHSTHKFAFAAKSIEIIALTGKLLLVAVKALNCRFAVARSFLFSSLLFSFFNPPFP